MPRVSSAPEDTFHMKGSWQDGWDKIVACQSIVFQFPPMKEAKYGREAGWQGPPELYAELTVQRYLDGDGNVSPSQPEEILLKIQGPNKETGLLDLFHPGNYPDGNLGAEPEDAGGELGAVGNTVYSLKEGLQLMENCKWVKFCASLQEKGFKKEILRRTYFPDMVGLYAFIKTVTGKKYNDKMDSDPTWLVASEVKEWPYEKKATGASSTGKKAAGKPPAASAPGPKPVANAAASPSAVESNGAGELTVEEWAVAVVTDTLVPAKRGQVVASVAKLKVDAFMAISKHKPSVPAVLKKEVQNQLGNEEWLVDLGAIAGYEVQADGKVSFAN